MPVAARSWRSPIFDLRSRLGRRRGTLRRPKAVTSMLHGATVLVVGRYAVALLGWTGTVIIVRQLTPGDWGRYTLIFGLLGIIGFISDLKLSRIVLARVLDAGEHAGEVIGSYITLRILIGVASYAIAMAVVLVAYPAPIVRGTAVAGLNLVVLSAAYGLILLFEARYWLSSVAVSQFVGMVVQFLVTVGIAVVGIASILSFAWATVFNGVVVVACLLVAIRQVERIRLRVDLSWWWSWLKEAAPLALGSALDTVYFRIDIVMLSFLATDAAVGTYGVGYKFSDLLGAIPLAVVAPAMTMLVSTWPSDPAGFHHTFRHAWVLLTVAGVGASVGFAVFAEPLVTLLYTDRYRDAALAARLLVVGQGLHFYSMLFFVTLVSARRNRLYPLVMVVGVVINIVLNAVLIPEYSYDGSGVATVVTEAVIVVALGVGVARISGTRPFPWLSTSKCLVAGGLGAAVGLVLVDRVWLPIAIAALVVTYLAALHLLAVDGPGGLRVLATRGRITHPHGEAMIALDPDLG